MGNHLIALLLGIVGSFSFHLSKGFQRLGIVFWDCKRRCKDPPCLVLKNGIIYIIGILMNYSYSFWMIAAVHFAPASYFTSVYSLGVLGLLVFSKYILNEDVGMFHFFGNIVIAIGAVILIIDNSTRNVTDPGELNITIVLLYSGLFFIISLFLIYSVNKSKNLVKLSIVLGMFTGGISSLDPIFKSIGLHIGDPLGYLPVTGFGWIFFLTGFIFTTLSFWGNQFGFSKKVSVSILVTMNSLIYSILPVIIQLNALPGYDMGFLTILSFSFISLGALISLFPAFSRVS